MRQPAGLGPATAGNAIDQAALPVDQVKAAIAVAAGGKSRHRDKLFSVDHLSGPERMVVPILGIYLGFSVARLHERFPVLTVPFLLWGLMWVILLVIASAIGRGGWRDTWARSPQLRLFAVLTLLAVVTVPLGVWLQGALAFLIDRFTVVIAVYVACLFLFRDPTARRRAIAIYVMITTVMASANLIGYFGGDVSLTNLTPEEMLIYKQTGVANVEHLRQTFGSLDANDIAAIMATTVPLALWLAAGNMRRRVLWTPCALILVVAVIPTASRGGLLGLVAAAGVLVLVGAKGWKRTALVSTLAVGALAFMALAGSQLNRMSDLGTGDYNYTTSEGRIAIWKRGIVWMVKRPWGYGLDNFPVYFGWMNGPERAAHNSLIQFGVELGVLGLAAYLVICVTLVKSLLKIRRLAIRDGASGNEMVTLSGHVLAMLAACWTTGFFLSNAYHPLTYMAIGLGSAIVLSASESLNAAEPAAVAPPSPSLLRRRRQLRAFEPV